MKGQTVEFRDRAWRFAFTLSSRFVTASQLSPPGGERSVR